MLNNDVVETAGTIKSASIKILFYSNRGCKRDNNEDAVVVSGCSLSGVDVDTPIALEVKANSDIFCVIDGMGGYKGGRLAAQIIAQNLQRARLELPDTADEDGSWLKSILREAAEEMRKIAQKFPELARMGGTMAGLYFFGDFAYAFNCGDSRVYRFCYGYLEKLTHDHSIVQQLFDTGEIKEEEMRTHTEKNKVTSSIDTLTVTPDVFLRKIKLRENDSFFMCSDGVWEALSLGDMEKVLSNADKFASCSELVNKLFEDQCQDNVSFIFVNF